MIAISKTGLCIDPRFKLEFYLTHELIDPFNIDLQGWTDDWYEKDNRHQGWHIVRENLAKNIKETGQRNPVCLIYKDGKYICTHGRQRTTAMRDIPLEKIRCIVKYKELKDVPQEYMITSLQQFQSCFVDKIKRIHVHGSSLEVIVEDEKSWSPDDYR